ncbi:acyltransferase [Maribacter sp. SA7]|uniref:acyltransferase family protein n=1 Tax=Maribacter zhoushanensis TaxID=3030012 RepID=UPI0023EB1F1C|nr:acyltransferase [Maribacter zhoushanensis]MDF4201871.1 acyltransferase [Maribacter zhoushanensis]
MELNRKRKFRRLKILDSIRGMAALVVLYHHIFKLNKNIFHSILSEKIYLIFKFISDLNFEAVLLFFIISGFSIGLSTIKRPLKNKDDINGYLYRRFKRILPIYWIAITLSLLIGLVMNLQNLPDFNIKNLIGNLLFLQTGKIIENSWVIPYGLNGPLWSLSFEMFFYLFFPLVYLINSKYLKNTSLYIKYSLLILLALLGILINKKILFIPQFLFLGGFVTWILAYFSAQYFINQKKRHFFFLINFIFGLIILLLKDFIPSNNFINIGKGMCMNGIFYFAIVILDKIKLKKLESILNFLFYKIGEGSYAIYALHYPILLYFKNQQIALTYQLIFFPFFFVVCYFLEKESIKWKLKFLNINYLKPLLYINKNIKFS